MSGAGGVKGGSWETWGDTRASSASIQLSGFSPNLDVKKVGLRLDGMKISDTLG